MAWTSWTNGLTYSWTMPFQHHPLSLSYTLPQRSPTFSGCASQNVSLSDWELWRIDLSAAPLRPTYSHVSPVLPTWHPDDGCGLPPHIVWTFRPFISLYSRQAGVSGFGCHRLERPAYPRRICAVTRGFQTTIPDLSVFPFLPKHYHMTRVLQLPFVTTV